MCGIAGFVGSPFDTQRARHVIRAMCQAIQHRGPDDEGYFLDPNVALGIRRLSIIDVADGHQPIGNEDESIWTVFNGEIYNFLSLREELLGRGHRFRTRTDTETIVHLFEEMGPDAVTRIDGMFAFAIWDTRRGALVLARDRMGKKPLHYTLIGEELIFGSELKAVLRHPRISPELSLGALARYLMHDYVPAPGTIFHNVYKLAPGHVLVYEDGHTRLSQYWDLPAPDERAGPSEVEAAAEIRQLLEAATRRRLISDVPLGAFLSGGIDSSAVVAMMAQNSSGRIKTFHIGFDDKSFDESRHARHVAACLGTDHLQGIMTPRDVFDLIARVSDVVDEPMADASILPTYLLSCFTRQHVTVALSGDGGDELFGGYPTYQAHQVARFVDWIPRPLLTLTRRATDRLPVSYANFSFDFKVKKFISGLGHPSEIRHAIWLGTFGLHELPGLLTPEAWSQISVADPFSDTHSHAQRAGGRDWLGRLLYLDAKLYLQDGVLVKVDRASMACSLEVRCPFLDRTIVEYVSRLPSTLKLRGLTTKYLLKRSLRGLLPEDILRRPKKGFGIPLGRWIRTDLRALFQEVLNPARIASQGIFRADVVHRLLTEHLEGHQNNRKHLWNLFVFQMWYRTYVDGRT